MDNRITQTNSFSDGVKACLPTVMGYLGIGIAMGIVGKSAHLAIWQIFMMSTLVYAGSAQFYLMWIAFVKCPHSINRIHCFSCESPTFTHESFCCSLLQGGLFTKWDCDRNLINR